MRTSLLLVSLLCAGLVQAQGAYRWVDQDGKVHYGDRPPAAASGKAKELRLGAPAADKQVSFTMRQAMENFPVTLYVSADCGEGCKEASAYLRKRGIPFSEKNVATQRGNRRPKQAARWRRGCRTGFAGRHKKPQGFRAGQLGRLA